METGSCVEGCAGEAVDASYALGPDDLYVRARIESDESASVTASLHPKVRCAWTQPYR